MALKAQCPPRYSFYPELAKGHRHVEHTTDFFRLSGSAKVSYKITRGSTVIQTATIITAAQFPVGPNGVWYLCSGHQVLPSSPGAALLTASVAYKANGSATSVTSKQSVPVILK